MRVRIPMIGRLLWCACLLSTLSLIPTAQARVATAAPLLAADYSAAMRAGLAQEAQRADMPRYDLDLTVDPQAKRLSGTLRLSVPNTTGTTLKDVVLRLYPQFPPDIFGDGGDVTMDVRDVVVQGVATEPRYEARRTALRLPLPQPVGVNGTITLSLSYQANIVPWQTSDGTYPLPSYYPMLAAWQAGWRTDVTGFPDRVYAASALYRATIRVPSGWTAISGGTTIRTTEQDGARIFESVTGPVREFAFSVGRFSAARAEHNGVKVAVYHRTGDGLDRDADTMAKHIAASIATFDAKFGLYPFGELEFHLINAKRGFDIGTEFPGLVVILLNGRYTDDTRYVTAHEVAHQWFYGVLGNDIYNEPWLDEAFAQYSGTLVEEDWAGAVAFQRAYDRHVTRLAARTKLPVGLGIAQYGTWNTYYAAVYGRGAQFLHTLRREIGDEAFFAGLREYYSSHKYGIVRSSDVQAAFERSSGRDLDAIFTRWLGR